MKFYGFQFEIEFLKLLEGLRVGFLEKLGEYVTMLGEETVFIVLAALLYFVLDKKLGQRLMYVMCGNLCLNNTIKNFAKVARPFDVDPTLNAVRKETATGYSFPSGHTQTAAGWTTVLAQKIKKPWATIVCVIIIVLVAFSRLYLGVHYPSDVIVGAVIGVACAFLFGFLFDLKEDKLPVLAMTAGVYAIFAIIFLFNAETHYADFYKMFGFLLSYVAAYWFESRKVNFTNDAPVWKRIIRLIIGVGIALGLKIGLKSLFGLIPSVLWTGLLLDALRYFIMGFVVIGLYPWVFKKLKF